MLFEKQIEKIFRSQVYIRHDNPHGVHYFAPEDFPGLQAHPYTFRSQLGHELKGFFYHYDSPISGRLVVFDHGMGNGHRAYMREIEALCAGGWLVFSYDHTGCMASGGENINGFAQSLADLDDCMKALKGEPGLRDRSVSVIGHSWGGFSAMNITALHPEITHVVAMSGFISVEQIVKQSFSGLMKAYAKPMLDIELRQNPRYTRYNALDSLKNTGAKVLLIYSADDQTVHKAMHYDPLYETLSDKANVKFLLVDGKNHNPSYTTDAVTYMNGFFSALTKAVKRKELETPAQQSAFMGRYDWGLMTQQDMEVWNTIADHLKK